MKMKFKKKKKADPSGVGTRGNGTGGIRLMQ